MNERPRHVKYGFFVFSMWGLMAALGIYLFVTDDVRTYLGGFFFLALVTLAAAELKHWDNKRKGFKSSRWF